MKKRVPFSKIRLDGETQPRESINHTIVESYANDMRNGASFPPIVVFFDGKHYWLADGFHRYFAAKKVGDKSIVCDVHTGTVRDAILYSCGANASHGSRREESDKRYCVTRLLKDEEWGQRSSRWIAEHARVGHAYVDKLRRELDRDSGGSGSHLKRTGKDGKKQSATKKRNSSKSVAGTSSQAPPSEPESEPTPPVESEHFALVLPLLKKLSDDELREVIKCCKELLAS